MSSWMVVGITSAGSPVPFSFVYAGKRSSELLAGWRFARKVTRLDADRTTYRFVWTDPRTGLEVRCDAVDYSDFPAVEWTVRFRNAGGADTPILKDIRGIDAEFARGETGPIVIHTNKGDDCAPDSYQPIDVPLQPGEQNKFTAVRGRPTQVVWPYWNLGSTGQGMIVACGWPGQWSAEFSRDADGAVRITAGQEVTRFTLHPGEEVRSALIALVLYSGDPAHGQNVWRRWMMKHNVPRVDGATPKAVVATCAGGFFPGIMVNAEAEKEWIDRFERERIELDYYWIDAGWYRLDPNVGWLCTGTWEVDTARYPKGIREVADYAHARGKKLVLWHEPERVHPGTWLANERPDWVSGGKNGGLLDLGNPECWKWAVEKFDKLIKANVVDIYRQDYNIDPLDAWRAKDTPDRQGIAENKHVTGYLAFWDELRKRNPHILIDSCASGGRRNDLETLRRSVPMLRSDYQSFAGAANYAAGNQGHTYGLSSWVPWYGQGVYWSTDQFGYCARSHICPLTGLTCDIRNDKVDWNAMRKAYADAREIGNLMLADYYPLTPYSIDESQWIAWQFDSPETGHGCVQAFRRFGCESDSITLKLRGLTPGAVYEVRDIDRPGLRKRFTGRQLARGDLSLTAESKPQAFIVTYRLAQE